MLFTDKDIQRILKEVDLSTAKLIARVLGRSFLTKYDIDLLKKRGVDLVKLIPKFPVHYQSFLFGRLSAALGDSVTRTMAYSDLLQFLPKMGDFVPNAMELSFYDVAANKTYTHIKGFGDRLKNDVRNAISAEEMSYIQTEQAAKANKVIHDEILNGTVQKRTVQKIASNIAHQMDDWNRDWGRIVETECQDVFNLGRAQTFMQDSTDPKVYFQVYPGACRHCIRLYLTHGVGSQPRLFNLSELMANGTNYGVKSKEWKPTVHPVHPYCRCQINRLPEGYVWNEENHRFEPPKNYVRKVQRKSKVHIDIGDKHYDI